MSGALAAADITQPTADSAAISTTATSRPNPSRTRLFTWPLPRRLRTCRWRWVIGTGGGGRRGFLLAGVWGAYSARGEDRPALVSLSREDARSPAASGPRSEELRAQVPATRRT